MVNRSIIPKAGIVALLAVFSVFGSAMAQFLDDFNDLVVDQSGVNGWSYFTGDGSAVMTFEPGSGYASIHVDATKDKRNIWYALIKRRVSAGMNLNLLSIPRYDFRIEARIRVSHAPRRVNLSLNTQRTTDFHTHLMEFDIPDTVNWHTISMTTQDFDAIPGDNVFGQLALMDWGLGKYRVDLDYLKVDIVHVDSVGPDQGAQVPYHPPIPSIDTFSLHIPVYHDCMVDFEYPDYRFNNWYTQNETGRTTLLSVNSSQFVIMRWDLSALAGKAANGSGLLELTTHTIQRSSDYNVNFGMVRVIEILGGDPAWNQKNVTYNKFCKGQPLDQVLNTQMIIDVEVAEGRDSTNFITISNPVLQRMIEGKTLGLAIRPLGAVQASFYAMENQDGRFSAKLHLNVDSASAGLNILLRALYKLTKISYFEPNSIWYCQLV
jgi:hypothetical protein